jgi:hypothetical protein
MIFRLFYNNYNVLSTTLGTNFLAKPSDKISQL